VSDSKLENTSRVGYPQLGVMPPNINAFDAFF